MSGATAPRRCSESRSRAFPNMFILYGPNTNHGSGSGPFALECGFRYILDAVRRLRDDGLRWIDLKPEIQAAWRDEIDRRNRRTIWVNGGCSSWYVHERAQHEQLARLVARVPPADHADQPGALPGRRLSAGG